MDSNTPENTPIITSDTEKKQPPKALITVIAIVIIIAACAGVLLAQKACSDQAHSAYATGESYTVTGHVQKVTKEKRYLHRGKRHTVYSVEIQTNEALPDGSHLFTSNVLEDYLQVSKYADSPEKPVLITIDEKGYISSAEDAPYDAKSAVSSTDQDLLDQMENMSDEERSEKLKETWRSENGK